jgi:hypothetical protein
MGSGVTSHAVLVQSVFFVMQSSRSSRSSNTGNRQTTDGPLTVVKSINLLESDEVAIHS